MSRFLSAAFCHPPTCAELLEKVVPLSVEDEHRVADALTVCQNFVQQLSLRELQPPANARLPVAGSAEPAVSQDLGAEMATQEPEKEDGTIVEVG